jgi:branched-chain amino acid transport system ATP-binding protein
VSAAAEPAPVVEARGLHTYYGSSHVLHGVDLTIGAGECVSLMGRNGMGKTTTIRSILGLTPPRRGTVAIHGHDMTGARPYRIARQGIGVVPEGRGIFPTLSVRENLIMAARAGRDGRVDWTLERVLDLFPRLAERITNMGDQLSGGEQQMLSIGRALMTNPTLLVLDEATEGLAPIVRKELWAVISQVCKSGIASLIVDKDVNRLVSISNRSVILSKGRVVFGGPSSELAADPEAHLAFLGV